MAYNPIDDPVDHILLNDLRSPGVALVSGAAQPYNWQVQQGFGLGGAIVIFRGIGLAEFEVVLQLQTVADFTAWDKFRPLVAKPPKPARPRALKIWHPHLEQLQISSVVVKELSQLEVNEFMTGHVKIKFLQYRRPRLQLAKPDGAAKTKITPAQAEIQSNTALLEAQLRALGGP